MRFARAGGAGPVALCPDNSDWNSLSGGGGVNASGLDRSIPGEAFPPVSCPRWTASPMLSRAGRHKNPTRNDMAVIGRGRFASLSATAPSIVRR